MTTGFDPTVRARIERYLDELRGELRDLPPARREEVVADIADHLALLDAGPDGEAAVTATIEQLGTAQEIARTARAELSTPPPSRPGGYDLAAVLVLLLGGLVVGTVLHTLSAAAAGWLVGLVLVWASPTWRTRDKVLATLVVPLGPGLVQLRGVASEQLLRAGSDGACLPLPDRGEICQLGTLFPPVVRDVLFVAFLIVSVAAPLAVSWRLLRLARVAA